MIGHFKVEADSFKNDLTVDQDNDCLYNVNMNTSLSLFVLFVPKIHVFVRLYYF